jgi:hypothetical protein
MEVTFSPANFRHAAILNGAKKGGPVNDGTARAGKGGRG